MERNNKEVASELRNKHFEWRRKNFSSKEGFFPVFYGFKDYLPKLSGGAVSLFLYLGLHSNNQTGECFHDITTIADFFGKSPRTVSSWIKELEEIGLIKRMQLIYNGVSHTFIMPYKRRDEENDQA